MSGSAPGGAALSGPDWFDADGPDEVTDGSGPGGSAAASSAAAGSRSGGFGERAGAGTGGGASFGAGAGRGASEGGEGEGPRGGRRARGRSGSRGGGGGAGGWSKRAARADEPTPTPAEQASRARGLVVDALSRTERTRGQLTQMLARKGIESEVADEILDRFTDLGLIDDAQYALRFVESRHVNRGLGSQALAFQLRQRGVDGDLVSAALEQLDDEQQFETACRLAQSRLARMSRLEPQVQQRRLAGFLARKGYSGGVAMRAVRMAMENQPSGDEFSGDVDLDEDAEMDM